MFVSKSCQGQAATSKGILHPTRQGLDRSIDVKRCSDIPPEGEGRALPRVLDGESVSVFDKEAMELHRQRLQSMLKENKEGIGFRMPHPMTLWKCLLQRSQRKQVTTRGMTW